MQRYTIFYFSLPRHGFAMRPTRQAGENMCQVYFFFGMVWYLIKMSNSTRNSVDGFMNIKNNMFSKCFKFPARQGRFLFSYTKVSP